MNGRNRSPWDTSDNIDLLSIMQRGLDLSRSPSSRFPRTRQSRTDARARAGQRWRQTWARLTGRCARCHQRRGHRSNCPKRGAQ